MATRGGMLWARADSGEAARHGLVSQGKGQKEWQTGGVGREVRAREKRAESAGQSRSFFSGYEAAGAEDGNPGVVVASASGPGTGLSRQLQTNFSPGTVW